MRADAADPEIEPARRVAEANGRHGVIGLKAVITGPTALDSLAETVAGLTRSERIVILENATPMRCGPASLKPLVSDLLGKVGKVRRIVLGAPDGGLQADTGAVAAAAEGAAGAGCLVSVGSGTITDIAKEAARIAGMPLVAVQTAASVNGYADGMAVVLRDGVKRTVSSAWPAALVIDTRVLAGAPPAMTAAGFGEMMSMFTAPADWHLAALAGADDSYDPEIVALFRPQGDALLAAAPRVRAGEESALALLARLLTGSGLAMGAAGKTAPLSGMEHLISHLIDMSAVPDGRRTGLHGAQIGVASLIAACLWERVLAGSGGGVALHEVPSDEAMQRVIDIRFAAVDPSGAMAAECWSDYQPKLVAWREGAAARHLARTFDTVKAKLAAELGDPARIAAALAAAGAPRRFGELDPPVSAERARWAVGSCHLMRGRFTIADLAFFAGRWTDDDVDAVLDRAARLGGGL